ncbi:SDR family NAD(P)-dependent oxidoreductase [Cryomorpha ignava]|uniref:SDR family NAD(P)-dependent oxidoreductase n=1 Tax=Cryomorpha ignava TaxID=101383 RepID=A0A7K3WLT5_9FLAO|nr:oxidoreductase [Cryomorpha ignava]NEN22616.1 SDR family NAD(P)-dependent oxidoreductase [Cryomorpha ignava]
MSENKNWTSADAPSLEGTRAIVTGANTGLGFETTKELAAKGAEVIMACRNSQKANTAKAKILEEFPNARLRVMKIDLASLESVRKFASQFNLEFSSLDLLINNAGVMMPPYTVTKDGFELQFEANYLGHFLLTGLLMRKLEAAPSARVISLSSIAHDWGDIYFDDLNFKSKYDKRKAYGQSKLACLMFAYELDRRLREKKSPIKSLAAHPGISDTELARYLPWIIQFLSPIIVPFLAQSAKNGAQPTLRAALDLSLSGGTYVGPDGNDEYKGKPVVVDSHKKSKDEATADRLWALSEQLVGVSYLD